MPLHDEGVVLLEEALQHVDHAVDDRLPGTSLTAPKSSTTMRGVASGRPRIDEEVPRVRIGVEEAVDEELLVEGLDQARRDTRRDRGRAASSSSRCVILMPSMNVMVSTSAVDRAWITSGKRTSGSSAKFAAMRSMHAGLVHVVGLAPQENSPGLVHLHDVLHGDEALVDGDGPAAARACRRAHDRPGCPGRGS